MGRAVRVVLVDDNDLARAALKNLLDEERDFEIVGEAARGDDALVQVRALRPELLLVDLHMPKVDGLEVIRAVKHAMPATRVVLVTFDNTPARLIGCLRAGANAYVLKGTARPALLKTLREALFGGPLLQREVATFLRDEVDRSADGWRSAFSEQPTAIERDLLKAAACGDSHAEMARALNVDPTILSAHISSLLTKVTVVRP